MAGVLYIVATPIGNLDDLSLRAIVTLRAVDLIAAEDTRHSRNLLRHHGIEKPLLSCHEHNEAGRCEELLQRIEGGQDIALISDAGTPLISDPGFRLVRSARDRGIRVSPIPGASSLIAALSAAGLPSDRFMFCGFLPAKSGERAARLRELRDLAATLVFFESSHRILATLAQIDEILGGCNCVLAKELTKLHENFLGGSAAELLARLERETALQRGEFVVLIDNSAAAGNAAPDSELLQLLEVLLDELSVKMAVKIAMRLTGRKKNEIYQQALQLQEKKSGAADGA